MKRSLTLILVCILFAQLGIAQISIIGKLTNKVGITEVKLYSLNEAEPIQTAPVDENSAFSFKIENNKADYYKLGITDNSVVFLILSPDENINITIDPNNPQKPIVKGSAQTERLYETNIRLSEFGVKKEEILKLYEQNEAAKREYVKRRIIEDPSALSNFIFLDILDPEQDIDVIEKMVEAMFKKHPDNKFVKEVHAFVSNEKQARESENKVVAGLQAPEINLPAPDGKMISLSSLKGKVVLIDFWASWCGPCRVENPNNVRLYNKYKSKGFEIFGVSLDKDRDSWLKAINTDGLKWLHVSDLKFWDSEAATTYNVSGIPFTVLVDTDGTIIQTGLRGELLEEKLEQIFLGE